MHTFVRPRTKSVSFQDRCFFCLLVRTSQSQHWWNSIRHECKYLLCESCCHHPHSLSSHDHRMYFWFCLVPLSNSRQLLESTLGGPWPRNIELRRRWQRPRYQSGSPLSRGTKYWNVFERMAFLRLVHSNTPVSVSMFLGSFSEV